jgi:hypothetical protein
MEHGNNFRRLEFFRQFIIKTNKPPIEILDGFIFHSSHGIKL